MRFFLASCLLCFLLGCSSDRDAPSPYNKSSSNDFRMSVKDRIYPFHGGGNSQVIILSVDGKEYIVNYHGGIIRHERP